MKPIVDKFDIEIDPEDGSLVKATIVDDNGVEWQYNGTRIFSEEAEAEFIANGDDPEQNGYQAYNMVSAYKVLVEDGYIDDPEFLDELAESDDDEEDDDEVPQISESMAVRLGPFVEGLEKMEAFYGPGTRVVIRGPYGDSNIDSVEADEDGTLVIYMVESDSGDD